MMQRNRVIRVTRTEYAVRKLLAYIVYFIIVAGLVITVISVILLLHWIPELLVNLIFQ